jgi:hypothetical protein
VPLLALLQGLIRVNLDTLEATSSDGFVSELPMSLITGGEAVARIAVSHGRLCQTNLRPPACSI